MLKLNVNQEKQLTFEVQIGGVQSEQVSSHLRIDIDGIEYGFPAEVGREAITVNLPPLRTVTARKLKEGEEVSVKLEIIADGNYLTPWQDTFRLANPLVIEAKIVDDDFNSAPAFKTKLVTTSGKVGERKQGVMVEQVEEKETPIHESSEDDLTERIVNKLAEKLGKTFSKKAIKEDEAPAPDGSEPEEGEDEDDVEEILAPQNRQQGGFGSIGGTRTSGGFGSIKGKPRESKKINPKDLLNMTEEDVYSYMERAGTKNPQVQKIIYEQAEAAAQSSKPYKVLAQVVRILKNKK
jgi:hypothetical protein